MAQTASIVKDGFLTYQQSGSSTRVEVDSADWYTWLETAASFAFRSEHGSFTARKERAGNRRGSLYWRAYYTRERKLHRIYLGKSEELTFERLVVVATALAGQGNDRNPLDADTTAVPSSRASLPWTTLISEQAVELPSPFPGGAFSRTRAALPTYLTSLLGREQDVQAVSVLLERHEVRLVTLTGPGGVGKTRLAVQVASHLQGTFADSVCFVSLASISDPVLVFSTIAQALGLIETEHTPILEYLKSSLREKHLLLLLDNFEQVVSAAPLLGELLLACPAVKALVTSRTSLRLQGEYEFPVVPLALPCLQERPDADTIAQSAAVMLFVERASAIRPGFSLDDANAAVIAAVCTRLDGLPLAIELAAARSKLLPPEALLAQLHHRLTVLIGGPRDLPARQQTLRGTIAWSYDLLNQAEKTLFRRLSVFVGGCTLEAAEAVCNAHRYLDEDVLDVVARLVDKSLLRQGAEIDGEPRLLLLETIREYALERLQASGETETLRRQHATFFLAMAEKAYPKTHSAEQSTWFRRLEADHDNLRAALQWTLECKEAQMGLRLAGALHTFWITCNHEREGCGWLEQVLAQPDAEARTLARAKVLRGLGLLLWTQGDFPEAQRVLEESVSIGREMGAAGTFELSNALQMLAQVVLLQGNPGVARELAGESLRLFQELGVTWGAALALHHLGEATAELGDPGAARPLLEESAKQFRVAGDWRLLAWPIDALGLVALQQRDYAGARTHFEEALSVARESGDKQHVADALAHLGSVALRMGEYHQSLSCYEQSLALNREQGYKYGLAEDLAGIAGVASLLGQPERAAQLLGAVEALREASKISLPPLRRAEYERTIEDVRAQLDEATFAAAWKEGRAMPLDEVLAAQEEILRTAPLPPEQPSPTPVKSALPYPHDLTQREIEVLQLVAAGSSNQDIAEQLVISERTVNSHLVHIFNKLGVNSRAAAAAFAIRHKLAE